MNYVREVLSWDAWPLLNFVILVFSALFVYRRSALWTGPSQAIAIQELRSDRDNDRERIFRLEENTSLQYQSIVSSIDAMRKDVHGVASRVGHLAVMSNRITTLETTSADVQQQVQFFKDLGCGYADCPRNRQIEGPKGGA